MNLLEKFKYCPVCGSSHFATASPKSKRCSGCGFEYFMNPAAAVVAFITNCKGELLVERRKLEPAKGTLDLPGGFADALETGEEAVAREVMEETGLKVSEARYLFSQPNVYRYSGLDVNTLDMFFRVQGRRRHSPQRRRRRCRMLLGGTGRHTHRAVRTAFGEAGALHVSRHEALAVADGCNPHGACICRRGDYFFTNCSVEGIFCHLPLTANLSVLPSVFL